MLLLMCYLMSIFPAFTQEELLRPPFLVGNLALSICEAEHYTNYVIK